MKYIQLYLICFAACLLCIDTTSGLSLHWVTAPLLTAFVISYPTAHFPQPFRYVIQCIIGECFLIICLIDGYCQNIFATPITPHILSNFLLSDTREAHEFISTFVGLYLLSYWRITALLFLCLILPIALSYSCKLNKLIISRHKFLMVVIVFSMVCEILPSYSFIQLFCQHRNLQKTEGLIFRHYHEEIPTPIHRFAFAYYSLKLSKHVLDNIKKSTFSVQIDSCSHQSPHIVLVIGESYNKHHSTLYGYHLPTTPLQQKSKANDSLFVFTDVVTPWNITSNVFLDIFSVWEYGMADAIDAIPLFPILFQRAGYSVNFFSNQYLLKGFRRGATNQAGHFFIADMEMSDSLFSFRNRKSNKFDLGLVEQVKQFKDQHHQQTYTLDIIHLIGQHFDYSLRYPKKNKAFGIEDYADRNIDDDAKKIVMQYDNATFYNDIVLDSILTLYEHDDAIVLFVADHGEEVHDELPIHGRLFQEPTAIQARNEFEVPMWIWFSRSYRDNHPEIVSAVSSSTSKAFLTDGIPQILLYLAGIKCAWTDDTHNLLSSQYQPKQRIIGGVADYDILTK